MRFRSLVVMLIAAALWAAGSAAGAVPTPEEFFGFRPGTDRRLIDYEQLTGYLAQVAQSSPRVRLTEVGSSALGRPMYVAFVSSEANLARLEALREVNRRLALDPAIPDEERAALIRDSAVFVMAMLSMHSTEVAPAQALPLLVYELATAPGGATAGTLDDVVLMVVPTHNPDGMDMVVEHYRKYLGTPYEGSSLPGVYHRYVGHDNNRDYLWLTQPESRTVNRLYSLDWFPQVIVDKHQMGSTGPRYFVPEYHDPIAEAIDESLWYWSDVFGSKMARDLGAAGLSGVASHWVFDEYWPGASSTSHWKGAVTLLTEAASCRIASPIFVEPSELSVRGKGLAEYAKSVNMPEPWPGGWWRLGDIVQYELVSMRSILTTAARQREEILRSRNDLCRSEVERGRSEPPFYFVLPSEQWDRGALPALVDLLVEHGVEVARLTDRVVFEGAVYDEGDVVVPLAQPFRAFVKEVMEPQRYPVRHYTPGGDMIEPYDITSWSLPLHSGVRSTQLDTRSEELERHLEPLRRGWPEPRPAAGLPADTWGAVYPANDNESFRAAFAALGRGLEVGRLAETVDRDGLTLARGSFVIRGRRDALDDLVRGMAVPPLPLRTRLDADTVTVRLPRVGLVETYFHDMDAGWTRYLLDSFGVPFRVIRPAEVEGIDLAGELDIMVFPDVDGELLTEGRYKVGDRYRSIDLPPEFCKPISKEGLRRIAGFIRGGGTVLSWGGSTALFLDGLPLPDGDDGEQLELPARDISKELEGEELNVPGSWLAVRLLADHPLTWGMPATSGVFSSGGPVIATSLPRPDTDRRVIATYPERGVLVSGHIEGEQSLAGKPAMVWLRAGRGQLVLYGFNPLFRASTPATYKLLFNALLLGAATE